ncbi:MAG: hypothetical protein GF350_17355, partial [Chitinivibrionales bacterium]|nr:hypothetical protein [Chitinivibrionales bacterium]
MRVSAPPLLLIAVLLFSAAADETVTITHDSMDRRFVIHTPPSYDGTIRVPLVLDFHGYGGSPISQKGLSGFLGKSDEEGFIVVWPEGYESSWNAGPACCGGAVTDSIDDIGFILQIVEFMKLGYEIDTTRIYATGHSNGSAICQRLANDASGVFAAVAGFALMLIVPVQVEYPVAVINFHGYD